jgi:putative transposase
LHAMREAVSHVRQTYPFEIDAWVTLPDHIHALWTLPYDDSDFGKRWGLIKRHVSMQCPEYEAPLEMLSLSNTKRGEKGIWQRRFWEHQIKDEADFEKHMDYIHFNPVKHCLVESVVDWRYSTFHKYVARELYSADWGGVLESGDFGE